MDHQKSIDIAKQALKIMNVSYKESDDLHYYVEKLTFAMLLPATTTEAAIQRISREIADEIQKTDKNTKKISELLEELDFEVSYLSFD